MEFSSRVLASFLQEPNTFCKYAQATPCLEHVLVEQSCHGFSNKQHQLCGLYKYAGVFAVEPAHIELQLLTLIIGGAHAVAGEIIPPFRFSGRGQMPGISCVIKCGNACTSVRDIGHAIRPPRKFRSIKAKNPGAIPLTTLSPSVVCPSSDPSV